MTPCGCKAPIASRGPFLVLKRPSNTVGGESLGAAPVNRRALAPKGLTVILSAGAPNPLNTRCMSPLLKMNASARRSGRRCDGARRGFAASSPCNHQQGLFNVRPDSDPQNHGSTTLFTAEFLRALHGVRLHGAGESRRVSTHRTRPACAAGP